MDLATSTVSETSHQTVTVVDRSRGATRTDAWHHVDRQHMDSHQSGEPAAQLGASLQGIQRIPQITASDQAETVLIKIRRVCEAICRGGNRIGNRDCLDQPICSGRRNKFSRSLASTLGIRVNGRFGVSRRSRCRGLSASGTTGLFSDGLRFCFGGTTAGVLLARRSTTRAATASPKP
jgi:hypothetical protein